MGVFVVVGEKGKAIGEERRNPPATKKLERDLRPVARLSCG